jgi:ribose transport system permease protein
MRPNVPGTLVGVLFLGMVANGLNLLGLDFNFKDALAGIILVCALALAVAQQRLRKIG